MEDNKIKTKKHEECYLCGKLCAAKGLKAHIRSHTNITIYDCDECGHRFSTKKLLQQHKITHRTHYLCEDCNGKYKDTDHLKRHKCIPVMEQRECKFCGKFCAPKGLMPHIRSHANHDNYSCDECGSKFSSKKKLSKHKTAHRIYFTCDECNGKYKDEEHLKSHTCIYGKERNHFCEFCGKAFYTKYDLNRHIRTHTNEKPYVCDVCNKGFTQKSNHDSHYRTHIKKECTDYPVREKKFVCEICFQAFGYKQHLKRHHLIHTKERPFKCETCYKSFSQKSYLKLHALVHTNEKPFKCGKCDRRFPCKWRMVQHEKRHEEPRIFCPMCDKGFYMPYEYDRHLLTHTKAKPYICDFCHKGFTARWTLKNHYLSHVNRKGKGKRRKAVEKYKYGEENVDDPEVNENSADKTPYNLFGSTEGNSYEMLDGAKVSFELLNNSSFDLDEKPYPCHVCKKLFPSEEMLECHFAEFVLNGNFKCCMCEQIYSDKENLMEHHKVHDIPSAAKPYVCFLSERL